MTLAQKAGQAGVLMLFRKGWGGLVSFAVMAYLARILDTEDFGIVAISSTLIGIIQVVAVSGISEYLIFYKGEDERKVINACFWLNLIASALVSLVILFVAPFWGDFYKDDRIARIIYLLLIAFFFSMASAIPMALYRKRLNYKPLILIQTVFGTISNISQIGFAYFGFGVYSLVLPNAIITPLMAFALYWRADFLPQCDLGFSYWRGIFHYTKHVIGQRVLGKFVNEGDTIIIGKFFGMQVLGVYNLAFQFANLFTSHFLPIITNVSLPVFAKNSHNIEIVRQHYYKMARLLSFSAFPIIALMIINADFLILTIYGAKWSDAVPIFQILSLYVVSTSVSSPASGLYNALGRPQIGFYFTLIFTPIFIGSIFAATLTHSLFIVVCAITFLRILGSLAHFVLVSKLLRDSVMNVFRIFIPVILSVMLASISGIFIEGHSLSETLTKSLIFIAFTFIIMNYLWKEDIISFMKDFRAVLPLGAFKLFKR